MPQIVVTIFGPANLASNVGIILLLCSVPNLLNGPLGGAIYDAGGRSTFTWVILFGGLGQILGGTAAFWGECMVSQFSVY